MDFEEPLYGDNTDLLGLSFDELVVYAEALCERVRYRRALIDQDFNRLDVVLKIMKEENERTVHDRATEE